jgi:3-phosphoshikimate 1-carboxyvinyltransferase
MGIKTNNNKRLYKNLWKSKFKINKKIIIKNYLKDHRVFMTSVIAGLTFGGKWLFMIKTLLKLHFHHF